MGSQVYGPGVIGEVKGDKLILQIDLSHNGGFSAKGAGPNIMVASTGGNRPVAVGGTLLKVGLNVFRDPTVEEETQRPVPRAIA